MSDKYAFKAEKRESAGKGIARALRREGRIPAVIYGDKKQPVMISLDSNDANVEYNRGHMLTTLCDLDVSGDKNLVLARDVQLHPVTDKVEHIDFLRVTSKTKIAVNIPVNFLNEEDCPGLKEKGILNVIRFEVEVYCSATNIPETLDVDIATKVIGDSIKVSDASMPDGVSPVIDDRDFTIATIDAPKTIEEEEAEEAEAAEAAEGEEAEGAEGEEASEESESDAEE